MQPAVGIFFLIGYDLHIESTPRSQGEPYGDHLGHPGGHSEFFDRLIADGKVPPGEEYQDVPRGRVVYSVPNGEYIVYLDPCIRARPEIVKQIVTRLNLSRERYRLASDEHYRCGVAEAEKNERNRRRRRMGP